MTQQLEKLAEEIRVNIVNCIGSIGLGHIGGSLSIADLLAVLYGKHLRVDPKDPQKEGRDRLVCSKGHAGPAVYSALAEVGYFPKEWLLTLNQGGTKLPSHCDMNKTPGVDFTAGSLGQGFSASVGIALGAKLKGDGARCYAILGDGESQEGQVWEAAMYAAHKGLDNLIAFTDYNKMQLDGTTDDINSLEPLADKWRAFGWFVQETDGHDVDAIDLAIQCAQEQQGKPSMIILHTVKGKGVTYCESAGVGCHSMPVNEEIRLKAIEELRGGAKEC